jgi:MFS family permease
MRPGRLRLAAAIALVVAAAWLATPAYPPLDDGYISVDSAQSVLAGSDTQYASPPLTGVTSPPYTFLLMLLLAAGLPPLAALRAALALGLAALAVALWALARSAGLDGWRRFVLPIAVLAAGPVIPQATNGVETGWAMAAGVALIAASLARRPLVVAALAGFLPWLRPDLTPVAGLLFAASLWTQPARQRVLAIAVAFAVFIPWPLWLYADTGAWIPQTMTAKAAFFAEGCKPAAEKFRIAGGHLLGWTRLVLPAALLALAWVPRSTLGRLWLAGTAITLAAFTLVLPGGLAHNGYRYLYPVGVPLIALGIALSLRRRERIWQMMTLAVVAVSAALLFTVPWRSREGAERVAAATWVREHTDPRATVLVHDAGTIAVFTTNPLVDLVGLKTPASIAVHRLQTGPSCGVKRGEAVAAIARASGAQYFMVTTDWDHFFGLTLALREDGFRLTEVRAAPPSEYGYRIFRMERP